MVSGPTIRSLKDLQIQLSDDVADRLSTSYRGLYPHEDEAAAQQHLNRVLAAMKIPPKTSICRVNLIQASRETVMAELEQALSKWIQARGSTKDGEALLKLSVQAHRLLHDVITVDVTHVNTDASPEIEQKRQRVPLLVSYSLPTGDSLPGDAAKDLCEHWPERVAVGWPRKHRVVLCDRYCGEAILRGSDIFVKGILSADGGIMPGDEVAVYAHLGPTKLKRGVKLEDYRGDCIFMGLGNSQCKRPDFFRLSTGVGVEMSSLHRVGPSLPPLSGILSNEGAMLVQNLPSILVAHALQPKPRDIILDMCSAPGGKTLHLASLCKNQATIVACDRSRRRISFARRRFENAGATCITPLAMDTTYCVDRSETKKGEARKTIAEILKSSEASPKDGLLTVESFPPESFDRILLDPPCSALGLRPKLDVTQTRKEELESSVTYQRRFVREAVALLKPGGVMTYSTCTIHAMENEAMVAHILGEYKEMELLPIDLDMGLKGIPGLGLNSLHCGFVRRFDPSSDADTMGFFLAKFRKAAR